MGILQERDAWVTPVYEIERADPLMGGEHGINNLQARQLGCRTRWLKERLRAGHTSTGGHSLNERDVAEDAAIPESCLALEYPTAALLGENRAQSAAIEGIARALYEAECGLDTPLDAVYRGLVLYRRYGDQRFDFELFNGNCTFRDEGGGALRECIAGDDSIDMDDTSVLAVGESYVLLDPDGGRQEAITVKAVLTRHRFLTTEAVTISRKGGTIGRTSWHIDTGSAHAPQNGLLYTRLLTACHGFDLGRLTIAHEEAARFAVDWCADLHGGWRPCEFLGSRMGADGLLRTRFRTGGGKIRLRITALEPACVRHMAFTPSPECLSAPWVRTPRGSGFFRLSRFGALYGAAHAATEIMLSRASDFSERQILRLPPLPCSPEDGTIMDAGAEVRSRVTLTPGTWWWKARCQSTTGRWSLWSAAVLTTVEG